MTVRDSGDGPSDVICLVLGGGRGTRLYPLTRYRSKPAVPLAGKYRLIDVPISNCINSGLRKIYVVTQFNSASLNRHIGDTYKFDAFSRGFVEILAAEQTLETEQWYQGTADAVRRNLHHILDDSATHVLVLSGDALYRMDYRALIAQHLADGAEVTVCCKLVTQEEAPSFGIVRINAARRIESFHEKPAPSSLPPLVADPAVLQQAGLQDASRPYLASMGIYLFNREVLVEMLRSSAAEDFSKQVIPGATATHRIHAYLYDGYWVDIGTIRSFFHANLQLAAENKQFDFYDTERPIFTRSRVLPSSEIIDSHLDCVLITEGCLVRRARMSNCVVGIRSIIREGAILDNVVMMGADFYEPQGAAGAGGAPPVGIGPGSIVRNAIIDKNARIGRDCRIVNEGGHTELVTPSAIIRDGIVIVPKGSVIADGTVI
jgi:glucose-1-phosphate adenylyltransferase